MSGGGIRKVGKWIARNAGKVKGYQNKESARKNQDNIDPKGSIMWKEYQSRRVV